MSLMVVLPQTLVRLLAAHQVLRFALVGGVGFVVDALSFTCFYLGFDWSLDNARGMAFLIAATTVWWGNRQFTFDCAAQERQTHKPKAKGQWLKAMCSAFISALPNLVGFKLVMGIDIGTGTGIDTGISSGVHISCAFVTGIALGFLSNYLLNKYWVFAKSSTPPAIN